MKPHVVVTAPLYGPTMDQLDAAFTLYRLWEAKDPSAFLREVRDRVRGIATGGGFSMTAELMDALPKAEIISSFGVGVDAIDLKAAEARGIAVTNTPDVLTDDVADLAIALLLAAARRMMVGDRFVRSGQWLKGNLPLAQKVGGGTMGIVGFGRIGLAVAERAKVFGIKVVYHGPRRKPELPYTYYGDLKAMAAACNYLMITCPGGAETRNLVTAEVLKALGPKGIIVNVARGSVVDEPALVKALLDGTLGGAALDVFADEPRVPEALFALDNVVLQPHVGSATHDTRAAMGQLVVDNLRAHFAGQKLLTRVV